MFSKNCEGNNKNIPPPNPSTRVSLSLILLGILVLSGVEFPPTPPMEEVGLLVLILILFYVLIPFLIHTSDLSSYSTSTPASYHISRFLSLPTYVDSHVMVWPIRVFFPSTGLTSRSFTAKIL